MVLRGKLQALVVQGWVAVQSARLPFLTDCAIVNSMGETTSPASGVGNSAYGASALIGGVFFISLLPWAFLPIITFDEAIYISAARALLAGDAVLNREHPMLGKELIALSIALFGDTPLGWRGTSLVSMPLATWLSMRAMWNFTKDTKAMIVFGLLLATSCLLFVLGRVGTLDAPMLMFTALGVYCVSWDRKAFGAIAFGLALACKWTIAPLLPLLALALGWRTGGKGLLAETGRFGVIPLAVYAVTFAPGFFVEYQPLKINEFGHLQLAMLHSMSSYNVPNPYASLWWHWLLNLSPYWALAHPMGEVWRFVVLIVNPVSAYFILPAIVLAWWDRRAKWPALFFVVQMALAMATERQQFVHHYALPMACGFAVVSLLLSRAKQIWSIAATSLSAGAFIAMYPVLSGAPLASRAHGERYIILSSWEFVDFDAWSAVHWQGYDERMASQQKCMELPTSCLRKRGR